MSNTNMWSDFPAKENLTMSHFTINNKDDLNGAIAGLSQFCHNWCMNVEQTELKDDLVFRCDSCEFEEKETGKCFVKMFLCEHATKDQRDKATSMGSL